MAVNKRVRDSCVSRIPSRWGGTFGGRHSPTGEPSHQRSSSSRGVVPKRPRLKLCHPPPTALLYITFQPLNAGSNACDTTEGRLNVGTERETAARERGDRVMLDDASDFRSDDPLVSAEHFLSAIVTNGSKVG